MEKAAKSIAVIHESDLLHVLSLEREDGVANLGSMISQEWSEEEMRFSIFMDYWYDTLFSAKKCGMNWIEMRVALQFVIEVQDETKDMSVAAAVKHTKDKLMEGNFQINERSMKSFINYFFKSYMVCFELFQYCIKNKQPQLASDHVLYVKPPDLDNHLSEAKTLSVWQYEQRLSQIDSAEAEHKKDRLREHENQLIEDIGAIEKAKLSATLKKEKIDREAVLSIIQGVTSSYMLASSHKMQSNILESMNDLHNKLTKTIVPCPPSVGSPPRYPVNTIPKLKPTSAVKDGKSANPLSVITKDRKNSGKSQSSRSKGSKKVKAS